VMTLSNAMKKGRLCAALIAGEDLNLRPLGYEFDNGLVRLCLSMI
jgi:hypothetical protein